MSDSVTSMASRESRGPVISVSGIGKAYGAHHALSDVDLILHPGEVLGLVGPNGAGKSTLLRILSAMAIPTQGAGTVLGRSIGSVAGYTPFLGVMIERPAFIERLSAKQNLRLLFGIRHTAGKDSVTAALRRVGLDPDDRRPVAAYSLGMRQRLSLAQAIGEVPTLLILDEPTNGLDPSGIAEMRCMIRSLADEGMAVLLASHLLSEVEAVCDRVLMLKSGRVVRELAAGAKARAGSVVVELERDSDMARLMSLEDMVVAEVLGPRRVRLRLNAGVPAAARSLVGAGIGIEAIYRDRGSIERAYLEEVAR